MKSISLKKALIHTTLASMYLLPIAVLAQNGGGYIGIKNPATGVNSISDIILSVVKVVRLVAIPFVVLAIIYSGWLFIAAQGSPDKLKNARNVFLWTLVGTLVVLSSELIATLLTNVFK